jgi:cytochrome b pre-mRNA-processing protein 3
MLGWLKGYSERRRNGQQLYERIVAQGRTASLYEGCGVPDTMDGRLEMLLLHTVLSLDRLRAEGAEGQRLGQRIMEQLIADVDDALRQIGLGDDSVAIRVKRLAGALAERARDYRLVLRAAPDDGSRASAPEPEAQTANAPGSLEAALLEHVYRSTDTSPTAAAIPDARRLADYVRRARSALARLDRGEVLAGRLAFPPVIDADQRNLEI